MIDLQRFATLSGWSPPDGFCKSAAGGIPGIAPISGPMTKSGPVSAPSTAAPPKPLPAKAPLAPSARNPAGGVPGVAPIPGKMTAPQPTQNFAGMTLPLRKATAEHSIRPMLDDAYRLSDRDRNTVVGRLYYGEGGQYASPNWWPRQSEPSEDHLTGLVKSLPTMPKINTSVENLDNYVNLKPGSSAGGYFDQGTGQIMLRAGTGFMPADASRLSNSGASALLHESAHSHQNAIDPVQQSRFRWRWQNPPNRTWKPPISTNEWRLAQETVPVLEQHVANAYSKTNSGYIDDKRDHQSRGVNDPRPAYDPELIGSYRASEIAREGRGLGVRPGMADLQRLYNEKPSVRMGIQNLWKQLAAMGPVEKGGSAIDLQRFATLSGWSPPNRFVKSSVDGMKGISTVSDMKPGPSSGSLGGSSGGGASLGAAGSSPSPASPSIPDPKPPLAVAGPPPSDAPASLPPLPFSGWPSDAPDTIPKPRFPPRGGGSKTPAMPSTQSVWGKSLPTSTAHDPFVGRGYSTELMYQDADKLNDPISVANSIHGRGRWSGIGAAARSLQLGNAGQIASMLSKLPSLPVINTPQGSPYSADYNPSTGKITVPYGPSKRSITYPAGADDNPFILQDKQPVEPWSVLLHEAVHPQQKHYDPNGVTSRGYRSKEIAEETAPVFEQHIANSMTNKLSPDARFDPKLNPEALPGLNESTIAEYARRFGIKPGTGDIQRLYNTNPGVREGIQKIWRRMAAESPSTPAEIASMSMDKAGTIDLQRFATLSGWTSLLQRHRE